MSKFVILADGTCDLQEAFQKEYDIRVLPGHIVLPDKSDIPSPLTWERFTRDEFYTDLKKNPNAYATAPANIDEFRRLSRTRFHQDSFIEQLDFDYLEIRVIEE